MGDTNQTLNLTLKADGSGLEATLRDATGDVKTFKSAVDDSNASTTRAAASYDKLGASAKAAMAAGARATRDQGSAVAELIGQIDPAAAKFAKLDAQLSALKAFKSSGAISGDDFVAYASKVEHAREAVKTMDVAAVSAGKTFGGLRVQTAGVTQELSRLGSEALRGNFQRMEGSAIVLAQRMGLLSSGFIAVVGSIALVVGSIVGFAAAVAKGYEQQHQFQAALIATGNYAGTTAGELGDLRNQIGLSTGEYGKAQTALTALVNTGKLSGQALSDAARAAVELSELTGQSVEKTAAEIAKLADDPSKAVAKLNEQIHFLTIGEYENIAAMQKSGDVAGATAAAIKALADATDARLKQSKESTGGYVDAIVGFFRMEADAAATALQSIKDLGRTDAQSQYDAALKQLTSDQDRLSDSLRAGLKPQSDVVQMQEAAIAADEAQLLSLRGKMQAQQQVAAAEGQYQQIMQAGIAAEERENKLLQEHATNAEKMAAAVRVLNQDYLAMIKAWIAGAQVNPLAGFVKGINSVGALFGGGDSALKNYLARFNDIDAEFDKHKKKAKDLTSTENELTHSLDELANIAGKAAAAQSPLAEAYAKHVEALRHIAEVGAKAVEVNEKLGAAGIPLAAIQNKVTEAILAENHAYDENIKKIDDVTAKELKLHDVVGNYLLQIKDQTALIGLTDREREQVDAVDKLVDAWGKLDDRQRAAQIAAGHLDPTIEKNAQTIRDATGALYDQKKAFDLNKQVTQEYASIWSQSFNTILSTSGSIWTRLKAGFSNLVDSIIQYFAKLAIINPILNAMFGGSAGFSMLPTLANAFGGGGGAGGGIGGLFGLFTGGGGGGGGSSAGGAAGFSLFSPSSWIDAGKNLYSGFSSFFGGGSTPVGNPLSPNFVGPPDANNPAAFGTPVPAYGGFGSSFGYGSTGGAVLGAAGGLYAGYNEFKAAGGGAAGVLGGAAYGIGTFAIGGAVSAALAGGISAGLLAVPVVGWIAIAAMLVDKFSGGKLFGTAWQTKTAGVDLNIGPDGGTARTWEYQQKQGSLFSGMKSRTKDVASSQDAIDASQQLFDAVKTTMVNAAGVLKEEVPPVIDASLKTINEYDKKGHVTSTKYLVDALGQEWTEATADLAAKRIQADAILDTIAHTDIGKDAIAIAAQFQGSADVLADAAQTMLAATADIQSGHGLLGLNGTLSDTVDIVKKLQSGDESLLQTYARLQQETQTVDNAFGMFGATLTKSGADLVEFDDSVVTAFGGLQAFGQEMQQVFADIFSGADQLAAKTAFDKKHAQDALTGLGLDPNESFAEFQQQAQNVFEHPDLFTPDQLKQWADAVLLMTAWNADIAQNAQVTSQAIAAQAQAVANYEQFMAPFRYATDGLDDFLHAMQGLGGTLEQNIAQANALARAAGMQGASAQDVAKIIQVAAQEGAAAYRQLVANAQSAASQLYGDQYIADLKAQLQQAGDTVAGAELRHLITEAEGSRSAQQVDTRYLQASQLASMVGEIGAVGGQSIGDILKELGVPIGAFAKDLHMNTDQLTAYLGKQEEQASAALRSADYLQDIRDILAGRTLTYTDGSDFDPAKPTAHGYTPPGSGGNPQPGNYTDKPGASVYAPPPPKAIVLSPSVDATAQPAASQPKPADNTPVVQAIENNTREMRAMRDSFNGVMRDFDRWNNGIGARRLERV